MATDLEQVARDRADELRRLDSAAIMTMAEYTEETPPAGSKLRIGRYHVKSEAGEHVVVIQVAREYFGGMLASVAVDGFAICPDGSRRPMTEEEKWPYL